MVTWEHAATDSDMMRVQSTMLQMVCMARPVRDAQLKVPFATDAM